MVGDDVKSYSDYVALLRDSGIVAHPRLERLLEDYSAAGGDQDVTALARFLVKAEAITPWQHGRVIKRKARQCFLGNYKLLKPLGKGGMGAVFLAEHTKMLRKSALKLLSQQDNDPTNFERFIREARAVAALDHPNIVHAYEVETIGNIPYLVMEYVDGIDLAALVEKQGPLDCDKAADCIAQAADGLSHAHERGIIHRDIKPANLMLNQEGTVKVLDMGLARLDDDDHSLTGDQPVGTTDYLAPEQAIGSDFDNRVDIYALGGTLYFLLTGRPPFEASTLAEVLLKHQTEEPPDPRELRPEVPEYLAELTLEMLAKDPDDRPQSAEEIRDELLDWLEADPGTRDTLEFSASTLDEADWQLDVSINEPAGLGSGSYIRPRPQVPWLPILAMGGVGLAVVLGVVWLALTPTDPEAEQTAADDRRSFYDPTVKWNPAGNASAGWQPDPEPAGFNASAARLKRPDKTDKWIQGIVVDNEQAKTEGNWTVSDTSIPRYGPNYLHDGGAADGSMSVRYVPDLPHGGRYALFLIFKHSENRTTRLTVTVETQDGPQTVEVNQREPASEGEGRHKLGLFDLEPDTAEVHFSNNTPGAHTIADAVQFIPHSGNFEQDESGLVAIEAEHFTQKVTGPNNQHWSFDRDMKYSGGAAMYARSHNSKYDQPGYHRKSPRLDYRVKFNRAGKHYVWIRGFANDGGSDSCHVGIDGRAETSGKHLTGFRDGDWSRRRMEGGSATIDVKSPGIHTVHIWIRESRLACDKLVIASEESFTPQDRGPPESVNGHVFTQEDSGQVVVEAEHYTRSVPGDKNHRWKLQQGENYSGGRAMNAPDRGQEYGDDYRTVSPRLDYRIRFQQAGRHIVWIRGFQNGSSSNSCFVGLNADGPVPPDDVNGFEEGGTWLGNRRSGELTVIDVPAPGLHTLNIYMREDGLTFDKLIVTPDEAFAPADLGPPESPR